MGGGQERAQVGALQGNQISSVASWQLLEPWDKIYGGINYQEFNEGYNLQK